MFVDVQPKFFQLETAPPILWWMAGDRLHNAMYRTDHRRNLSRMYSVRNCARRTVFLVQVSHIIVLRWLRITERHMSMRFSQKNIMKDCSSSMIENEPLISIWKVKPTIVDTASVSVSQQLVHVVLKTLGYSHNKVRVHARLSSTEIAATAFLKRRDRYDAEKRRLFFSVYETCFRGYGRNVHGYLQRGSPLCL